MRQEQNAPAHVLVVEDDIHVLQSLCAVLSKAGHEVRLEARGAHAPAVDSAGAVTLGDLHVDAVARVVRLRDETLTLTAGEFDLLWELARRPGQVHSRRELYERVLRRNWNGEDRALDARIARLRRRLQDDARRPRWIHCARGAGYYLATPTDD